MKTDLLKLPFSDISVLVNGKPIIFEYDNSHYNTYYNINNQEIKVLGAMDILVNTKELKPNDIVYFYSSAGELKSDGGDERTLNAIAKLEKYTYGIGGPDTECIEWEYGNIPGNVPDAYRYGYTKHILDYEFDSFNNNGLKYKIIEKTDNTAELYAPCSGVLQVCIIWEDNAKPYAYDIVSCLSC